MITYKGHYEVPVTNVHGEKEKHCIRYVHKPGFLNRLFAKFAGFTWVDQEITMQPKVRTTAPRKSKAEKVN
jgi:hypothetical protein